MRLSKSLWHEVLLLEKEYRRHGKRLGRRQMSKLFELPEYLSHCLRFALDNHDLLKSEPAVVEAAGKSELILADLHIPYHDRAACDAVFEFADQHKPDIICILGDLLDMYQCSVFVKKPKKQPIDAEILAGRAFLQGLRERYPDAEIILKVGNHDLRMEKYILSNAPHVAGLLEDLLPTKLGLQELDIRYEPDFFRIGKLWHLHGHEKPAGGNPRYILTVLWKYVHDHFIAGHFHRTETRTFAHIESRKRYESAAVGWLGLAEAADYAPLNEWNQGFAFVRYREGGSFHIENYKIVNGEIY